MKKQELVDITAPDGVELVVRQDGKVIWVNVDGICVLRICRIGELKLTGVRNDP